jgi:ribokinase
MRRPKVCVIGSLNMDLVIRTPRFAEAGETIMGGPFATYPGGKGANQAVAAARLGAQVSFVGAVGDDPYAAEFRRVLEAEGVDCSHIFTKPGEATGVAVIVSNPQNQNSIVVALGANLALTAADVDAAMPVIREADVIMLQLEIPLPTVEHVLGRREEFQATIMLNAAPAQRVAHEVLEQVDVLVFNEVEGKALCTPASGSVSERILLKAVPCGSQTTKVLTLAERGCMTCIEGSVQVFPAFNVEALDTVGAGDAFCGALAVALAGRNVPPAEQELPKALQFASAAGALAVTRHGAIPSLPTRAELEAFLRTRATLA